MQIFVWTSTSLMNRLVEPRQAMEWCLLNNTNSATRNLPTSTCTTPLCFPLSNSMYMSIMIDDRRLCFPIEIIITSFFVHKAIHDYVGNAASSSSTAE
jgi:hypothetical protein